VANFSSAEPSSEEPDNELVSLGMTAVETCRVGCVWIVSVRVCVCACVRVRMCMYVCVYVCVFERDSRKSRAAATGPRRE